MQDNEDIERANALHDEAMRLADDALMARAHAQRDEYRNLVAAAFEKEREAASLVAGQHSLEPTRSVLHRSAASLALEAGMPREAVRLVASALSGDPPAELQSELNAIWGRARLDQELEAEGVSLAPHRLLLGMAGNVVGIGLVRASELMGRIETIQALLRRTAERRARQPFQDGGRPTRRFSEELKLYAGVATGGSYVLPLSIGRAHQVPLPGAEDREAELIGDMLESLELFSDGNAQALREKMQDHPYYRNFVELARKLAPDGRRIDAVSLQGKPHGRAQRVRLTTPRRAALRPEPGPDDEGGEEVSVRGTLLYADARPKHQREVRLTTEQGKTHKIQVPEGMMDDIVKPLWHLTVVVKGVKVPSGILLRTIAEADGE